MDEDGIVNVCTALDLKCGRAYSGTAAWGANMSVACPLAIKRHGDPYDDNMSCSIKVVPDGPSDCKCWSGNCKFKGKWVDMVRHAVQMRGNPPELLEMLKEVEAVESVTLASRRHRTSKAVGQVLQFKPPPGSERDVLAERFFDPYAGKVPQYAVERGISVGTAKAWGLGYDKAGGFLVFPVRRTDGKLVGLVGRAVSDRAKRRHHNYMGLDKSKHLFGSHMLELGKPVVIVESCIDALNTWQALRSVGASVVASLGEGFSDHHAMTISCMRPTCVYIFTDGDQAGRLIGSKMAYVLHAKQILTKIMECPWGPIIDSTADGKAIRKKVDPSVLTDEHIMRLYQGAPRVKRKIRWTNPPPFFDPDAPRVVPT